MILLVLFALSDWRDSPTDAAMIRQSRHAKTPSHGRAEASVSGPDAVDRLHRSRFTLDELGDPADQRRSTWTIGPAAAALRRSASEARRGSRALDVPRETAAPHQRPTTIRQSRSSVDARRPPCRESFASGCPRTTRSIACPRFRRLRPRCSPRATPNAAAEWPPTPASRSPGWAAMPIYWGRVGDDPLGDAHPRPSSPPRASTSSSVRRVAGLRVAVRRDPGRRRRRAARLRLQRSRRSTATPRGFRSPTSPRCRRGAGRRALAGRRARRARRRPRARRTDGLRRRRRAARRAARARATRHATSSSRSPASPRATGTALPGEGLRGGCEVRAGRRRRHAGRRWLPLARRRHRAPDARASDRLPSIRSPPATSGTARSRWRWPRDRTSPRPAASPTPRRRSNARGAAAGAARRTRPRSTRCSREALAAR